MGFTSGAVAAFGGGVFGAGTGTIWLDEVACTGTEAHIADCGHQGWGVHDCSHSQDAGVQCRQGE